MNGNIVSGNNLPPSDEMEFHPTHRALPRSLYEHTMRFVEIFHFNSFSQRELLRRNKREFEQIKAYKMCTQ